MHYCAELGHDWMVLNASEPKEEKVWKCAECHKVVHESEIAQYQQMRKEAQAK